MAAEVTSDLFSPELLWTAVPRVHSGARRLADRHYSRQTVGARDFMPPGRTFVLVCGDAAVWGVCENLDPAGNQRWRVTIFRNESAHLSSDLVREATSRTHERWARRFGCLPPVRLTTEVDPAKTRSKRDPGRCFRKAGWEEIDRRNGLVVLAAPEEERLKWDR